MKRTILCLAFLLAGSCASAQVLQTAEPVTVDGKLSEPAWRNAPAQTGFVRFKAAKTDKLTAQTEFKVLAGRDSLYLGIRCGEPLMQQLKAPASGPLWYVDGVEVFLSPTGQPDEYYQFLVTAGNMRWCQWYGEGGAIKPDPYAPLWNSAVHHGKDFWSAEIRLPLNGFYMTRGSAWKTDWLFNVARTRRTVKEDSTWSPLNADSHEAKRFRVLKGFPVRPASEDIYIQSAAAKVNGTGAGGYRAELKLQIIADPAAAGNYRLWIVPEKAEKTASVPVKLEKGRNEVTVPGVYFPSLGKNDTRLELEREADGKIIGRDYPVQIVYEPLKLTLLKPGYAGTFFPGQDFSRVEGELAIHVTAEGLEAVVSIEGGGLPRMTRKFPSPARTVKFGFDTKGMDFGSCTVTAELRKGGLNISTVQATVRRPAPLRTKMVWVEDSRVIVNGKAIFPRDIYAVGYRGGAAFAERFKKDNLSLTPFGVCVLEPARLVKGIEAEAVKDIRPSPVVFEKIRRKVEEYRNRDFLFYYLSDEPECRGLSPVYFRHLYEFIKELDPFHPVLIGSRANHEYIECADVFSTHPYIGPMFDGKGGRFLNVPVVRIRDFVRDTSAAGRGGKVSGFTPQFFSYGNITNHMSDYPTFEELEATIWSSIANGARLQWAYAYHDLGDRPVLYEGLRCFYESIAALEDILCNGKPQKVKSSSSQMDVLLLARGKERLLLVVNLLDRPVSEEIETGALPTLYEFRGSRRFKAADGKLKLSLKPYEVLLLRSEPTVGLRSRAEVLADIAAKEKARTNRENVLFGRGYDIEVDSSEPGARVFWEQGKLFDGTLDILGWEHTFPGKPAWYELNFPKFVPSFTRIRLHGNHIRNAKVRIWKAGEWRPLEETPQSIGKYALEWNLKEKQRTVKIRFDFGAPADGSPVELYEIELIQ
ncbi:MAG: hypothetical protein BWY31_03932 [Lentisphaerae bacterium ADurb.Bin242]|nr:MAG: hypothetical protein BWY31_03932 [Lentisphaerae bacterium ADurb.Bin242]